MGRLKVFDTKHYLLIALILPIPYLESCGHSNQPQVVDSRISTESVPDLVNATLMGELETVRRLLQTGTDPNVTYHTNTALTYAARDGLTEIARLLIKYGANVNWIDGEGVTPLILASFKDYIEIVQLLLEHGADVSTRDQWGQTALDYALRRGNDDPIAQLLTEYL